MRRPHLLAVLATTGVLVTASAATAAQESGAPSGVAAGDGSITFIYDEPFDGGSLKYVNLDKHKLGPGDMFLFHGVPMLEHGTDERIGVVDGTETVASVRHDGTVEMNMTLRLDDGLVMVSGVVRHTDKPFRIPVVGGTGAYANATGQMSVIREDVKRKVSVIKMELVV